MSLTGNKDSSRTEYIRRRIADLIDEDIKVSEGARICLLSLGEEAIPHLVGALDDPQRWRRWEAAKILAEMRNPKLAPVLARELENHDGDIRWLAAEGLLALGKAGLPHLLQALKERPTSTWLLQGARHVLKDLYLGRRHEGESEYFALVPLDDETKKKIRPLLDELERSEPSLKVSLEAAAALDYLKSTEQNTNTG